MSRWSWLAVKHVVKQTARAGREEQARRVKDARGDSLAEENLCLFDCDFGFSNRREHPRD